MTLLPTRRPLRTKHAVISRENDLSRLIAICLDEHITHLWITDCLDSLPAALYGDYEEANLRGYDLLPHWSQDGQWLASLVGHRVTPRSHRFNIIFCEHSPWAFLPACQDDPARLLDIIAEFERNLGVPMGGSPAGVGTRYLRAVTPEHKQHWLEAPEQDLSQINWPYKFYIWPKGNKLNIPEAQLQEAECIFAVDKNAAFPRAAKDVQLGIGEPHQGSDGEWHFSEHAAVLANWVRELMKRRVSYPKGHMRDSYKDIMNDTIGLFRSKEVKGSWKYRPDWYAAIVNHSNFLVDCNIAKFRNETGLEPFMVHMDAIYYISTFEASETALKTILELPDLTPKSLDEAEKRLGKYKLKYRFSLDETYEGETVRTILQSDRPQTGEKGKLKCLNKIAERLGYK